MTESVHLRRLQSRVARTTARFVQRAEQTGTAAADMPRLKLPWYAVRNQSDGSAEPATVLIFDEIGGSFGVNAEDFARDLEQIDAPLIRVRINSPGGSVFDALAIYNALNHHPARIQVFVDALAASAASIVAMGGDEIVMMPGSQMMIHDASAVQDGNAEDMAKMSTFLDRQSANVADLYRLRAGGEEAEWRALMRAETWMFAREAVALGLADRVEAPPKAPDVERPDVMTRSFDLSGFRYAGREAAPAPARRDAAASAAVRRSSTSTSAREEIAMDIHTRATAAGPTTRTEAATARAEAAARQAHSLAQEGRSVPVLDTSARYQTQLRVVRASMPRDVGAARLKSFPSKLQRVATVKRNGRELVHLAGYATVFGEKHKYEMWDYFGPYDEYVEVGAADTTLASSPDVAFLVNHLGVTMARTTNGTLELGADDHGMSDDAFVNAERGDVHILLSAVDDELIDEQSFAFMIVEGGWSDDFMTFRILEYDIDRGDVSAVNYGANPYTSISARGQQFMADIDALPAGFARAAFERLARRTDVASLRTAVPGAARRGAKAAMSEQHDDDTAYLGDESALDETLICPACEARNAGGAQFCSHCGVSLADDDEAPQDAAGGRREVREPVSVAAAAPAGRRITQIEALLGDD
jgi:HK97 family phage prohead protease